MADDTHALPAVPGSIPFVHNVDKCPAYWWLDILWIVLVKGEDTGGRYSLMYEALPPGSGAPPHKHTWPDEHFYILDGEITFLVATKSRPASRATSSSYLATRGTHFESTKKPPSSTAIRRQASNSPLLRWACRPPSRTIPPKNATPPPIMNEKQYRRYGMDNLPGPNPLAPDQK
ncbi:MAG: cupin domain-containing protein [Acidobacteriaceae bacterium]|nr:cupin domain-containing protein [Acidobacteriaceae bacterium]